MEGKYLAGVLCAVVAGTVAELIPSDEDGGSKHALRLLTSMLVLCVIALPLTQCLAAGERGLRGKIENYFSGLESSSAESYAGYAAQTMAYIREASREQAEHELAALLSARFGIAQENVRVELQLTGEEEITVSSVTVVLSGSAILADPYAIEDYLTALFGAGADCAAVIGEREE